MVSVPKLLFGAILVCCLAVISFNGCTPKTTEEAQASTEETSTPEEEPYNPCATFDDARYGDAALDAHVIYRDFIRNERFDQAMPYWRQAYTAAPAADGKRETHFSDGAKLYGNLLLNATSDAHKVRYLDTIFQLYDHMGQCYHVDEPGYVDGRKAFDLYYKYRDVLPDERVYEFFTNALDAYGLETPSFVINPFTAFMVEMYNKGAIDQEEAQNRAKMIFAITETHLDDQEDGWPIVLSYAPSRLEEFETTRGFYDCDYYKEAYYDHLNLDSVDCEEIVLIISKLLWGGCGRESAEVAGLYDRYLANCYVPKTNPLLDTARVSLEEGRYQNAIDAYIEYLETEDDPEVLAKFNLRIAKIYYGHLKRFTLARQYAREALKHKPNWGEPYIVIGKLYASSGPLCGPGRGWDSQIVTWPAIDKFIQAKNVDPSVSAEANKWIRYYQRFMPSVEDIFQRQLNEGDVFQVGCWIQESTRIRAAKNN